MRRYDYPDTREDPILFQETSFCDSSQLDEELLLLPISDRDGNGRRNGAQKGE